MGIRYEYKAPVPGHWGGLGSQAEIEDDWVLRLHISCCHQPKFTLNIKKCHLANRRLKDRFDPLASFKVTDSRPRIHLTVKLAPRKVLQYPLWLVHAVGLLKVGPGSWKFCDRNVDDVKDGYVSCQPFQDTRKWGLVSHLRMMTKMRTNDVCF